MPANSKWKVAVPLAVVAAAAGAALVPTFGGGASHREAPAISQDPIADSTDVYVFRNVDDAATKGDECKTASIVARTTSRSRSRPAARTSTGSRTR